MVSAKQQVVKRYLTTEATRETARSKALIFVWWEESRRSLKTNKLAPAQPSTKVDNVIKRGRANE